MKYGRYEIIKEVGGGQFGIVYQAYDPNLDLKVALKVLRQDRLTNDAFVKRFLAEAKILGRLNHPNIVRVYNVDEDQGTVYIAMEFVEGYPLNKAIEGKRFTRREVINLGIQVAEALDYAHKKGIVHRDVKPSNILVRENGQIKITDFGIAHIEDPSASVQTQTGEILGTPAYMSPEQVLSRPVDGRSDLFSLGIILYELSAGSRPFGGDNLAAVFNAITKEEPPHPMKVNPVISENLSRIIMRTLRKEPGERYETGIALAEALKTTLQENQIEKNGKRFNPFYIVLLILLVASLGGLSYYFTHVSPKKTAEKTKQSSLKVESSPGGAQVFVDDSSKGKTPLVLPLPPGKHEVRLTLSGHHDWEAQVELREEKETPLLVRFTPIIEKRTGPEKKTMTGEESEETAKKDPLKKDPPKKEERVPPLKEEIVPPTPTEGSLIRLKGDSQIYVIQEGRKCFVPDLETVQAKGYRTDRVIDLDQATFNGFLTGIPLVSVKPKFKYIPPGRK